MDKYLLDTNTYFRLLEYIVLENQGDANLDNIKRSECFISQATKIEIISVIGKHARGQVGQTQKCDRIHESNNTVCGEKYIIPTRNKWSNKKIKTWLKLEKEISSGINKLLNVKVLGVSDEVFGEAEKFIQKSLKCNFKSMDAIIVGTAQAYSDDKEKFIVVTADKAMIAGLKECGYLYVDLR